MSAIKELEDAAKTNEDNETPIASTASDNPDAERGDTTTVIVEDSPQTVLQLQTSSNDNDGISKLETTEEPKPDTLKDLTLDENVTTSTCASASKNDESINNKTKPETGAIGCKGTVIDDVSDLDLKLHWTDDEDDQLISKPLSDKVLKLNDTKLEIADAGKDIDQTHENILKKPSQDVELTDKNNDNIMDQDIEMTDEIGQKLMDIDVEMTYVNVEKVGENVQKVKDEDVETMENIKSDIIEADFQPSIDDALKLLDEEFGTDDSENLNNKGFDKKNDTVQKNLEAAVEEQTNPIAGQSKPINVTMKQEIEDTQLMNEGSPSEIEKKPSVAEINVITLKLELEMPDVKEEIVTEVNTEAITVPESFSGSNISRESNMDKISSANVIKTVKNTETVPKLVDVPINEEDITEPMTMSESVSGSNISIESNDQNLDRNNTVQVAKIVEKTSTVPILVDINKEDDKDITKLILASDKVDESNITKKSNDSIIDKNDAENIVGITEPTSIPKSGNDSNITKHPFNVDKVKTENVTKNEEKNYVKVIKEEFITPDDTNDSIKINTDHRINRPDVMLHIPSHEIDLDVDFDEAFESDEQGSSDRIDKGDSIMTATVTDIVKQLANGILVEKSSADSNKLTDVGKPESILDNKTTEKNDSNTTQDKAKQCEKTTVETVEKINSETIDKDISDKTVEIAEKALETNDNVERPQEETELQPSTSDVTKMTSDIIEEVPKVIDTLGLLTVSSRVMEDEDDDDQMELDEEDDDGADDDGGDEDDDDFDPDGEDSSNQTGEQSEESNPPSSEVDIHGVPIDTVEAGDVFRSLLGATVIKMEENEQIDIEPTIIQEKVTTDNEETVSKDVEEAIEATAEAKEVSTEKRESIALGNLLTKDDDDEKSEAALSTKSPDKLKNLQISVPKNVMNYVDLGESSSDDENQKKEELQKEPPSGTPPKLDKSDPTKKCKGADNDTTEVAAEKKSTDVDKGKSKVGEVFNLDSDEDDKTGILDTDLPVIPVTNPCVNHKCTSDGSVPQYVADRVTLAYYGAARRSGRAVCENCLDVVNSRNQGLVSGIKDYRPLMSLRMARPTQQLLEISDSDSDGENDPVGEGGAKIIEDQLMDIMNETWTKYNMDDRLKETENYLEAELTKMKKKSEQIDQLLKSCQKATDKLRVDFYTGFDTKRQELPALSVLDTPVASYACLESEENSTAVFHPSARYPKRRSTTIIDTPAKKQAFIGKKITRSNSGMVGQNKQDEDKDVSVVRLSAESAPADLPPPGEYVRAPLKAGVEVYAMKNHYGAWLRGRVLEVLPQTADKFTQCRVHFEHKVENPIKLLTARAVAYTEPCNVRMTIGTRVIALSKNSENANKRGSFFYSGVIAEIPTPVNSFRYLVFFDDGYVQYVAHQHTRLVYEYNSMVWEEVHPYSRDFVCNYLQKYPERPMVRMHKGQALVVELNGQWTKSIVLQVDAAVVKVRFPNGREEWLYRGSTRLQPLFTEFEAAKTGNRARLPRSTKASTKMLNMPYVEYTRSDGDMNKNEARDSDELRRQRAVAKKSTTLAPLLGAPPPSPASSETLVSRVVFYTPKNTVRPPNLVPHTCGPRCNLSVLMPLDELRTYNPLSKPLLCGWERQIVRHRYFRDIMYRAPCGRRVRSMAELHRYLRAARSELSVDLFDFGLSTHCLAEFLLNKSVVQKKDLSHGKENVPVPCVNYYNDTLPDFCVYSTLRTPTEGVPLNLDPEFLCGCDCEDDCADKNKCSCWKMTIEGARTIGMEGNVGYEYRRLLEPLPSGIYECNVRCKCKSTCLNRVVQIPLQLKLQVFKTLNRGWGIRSLNDVPKGSFLCIYAGNLLTDATANLDGLNEGDEYLAELDYIEVVEAMKEGYEDDIPEADKKLDKKSKKKTDESESESTESEDEQKPDKSDKEDGDFQPGHLSFGLTEFNKRLRRRDKKKNDDKESKEKKEEHPVEEKPAPKKEEDEECITISDDEEVRVSQREPTRLTAKEGMIENKVVPKYRSIRSYFGEDEACYIMDAKVQGNIGRYLNHSCSPNVFVQNVFVDTHDPRFPWVSFFALHHIRSGTELTWNYNYDVGSVPGKVLYCFCGAPNCRGRLL